MNVAFPSASEKFPHIFDINVGNDSSLRHFAFANFGEKVLHLGTERLLVFPISGPLRSLIMGRTSGIPRNDQSFVWLKLIERLNVTFSGSSAPRSTDKYELFENEYCQAVSLTAEDLNCKAPELLQVLKLKDEHNFKEKLLELLIDVTKTLPTCDPNKLKCHVVLVIFKSNYVFSPTDLLVLKYQPMLSQVIIPAAHAMNPDKSYLYRFTACICDVKDFDWSQIEKFFETTILSRKFIKKKTVNRFEDVTIAHSCLNYLTLRRGQKRRWCQGEFCLIKRSKWLRMYICPLANNKSHVSFTCSV